VDREERVLQYIKVALLAVIAMALVVLEFKH